MPDRAGRDIPDVNGPEHSGRRLPRVDGPYRDRPLRLNTPARPSLNDPEQNEPLQSPPSLPCTADPDGNIPDRQTKPHLPCCADPLLTGAKHSMPNPACPTLTVHARIRHPCVACPAEPQCHAQSFRACHAMPFHDQPRHASASLPHDDKRCLDYLSMPDVQLGTRLNAARPFLWGDAFRLHFPQSIPN